MKKILLLILPLLFLFGCNKAPESISSTVPQVSNLNETGLVRMSFDNYKSSILNDRGEDAVNYLDTRTVQYYSTILDLAKTANHTKLSSLSLMDEMMVLLVRYRVTKQELLSMDGKSLLVYALQNGMVGKNSVMNISIGDVSIVDNFAKGELLNNSQKSAMYLNFYKEAGVWKVDITSLFSATALSFQKLLDDSGLSRDDFMLTILKGTTGKEPSSTIWDPIQN